MPRTEPIAGLYPLMTASDGAGRVHAVRQGTATLITLAGGMLRSAFVDAATGLNAAPHVLAVAGRDWRLDFEVAPAAVAVVSGKGDDALDLSIGESIELAYAAAGASRATTVDRPRDVLEGVAMHTRMSALGWRQRVELEFLQAWIRRPEWLLFDGVFDHPDAAQVAHLPRRFHERFPLRALSFLGHSAPDLPGAVHAPALRF